LQVTIHFFLLQIAIYHT